MITKNDSPTTMQCSLAIKHQGRLGSLSQSLICQKVETLATLLLVALIKHIIFSYVSFSALILTQLVLQTTNLERRNYTTELISGRCSSSILFTIPNQLDIISLDLLFLTHHKTNFYFTYSILRLWDPTKSLISTKPIMLLITIYPYIGFDHCLVPNSFNIICP